LDLQRQNKLQEAAENEEVSTLPPSVNTIVKIKVCEQRWAEHVGFGPMVQNVYLDM